MTRPRVRLCVEALENRCCPSTMELALVPVEPPPEMPAAVAATEGESVAPAGTLREQMQWAKAFLHWKDADRYTYWGERFAALDLSDPDAAEQVFQSGLQAARDAVAELAALPVGLLAEGEESAPPSDEVIVQRARAYYEANKLTVADARREAVAATMKAELLQLGGATDKEVLEQVKLAEKAMGFATRVIQDQSELKLALEGDTDTARARQLENLLARKSENATTLEKRAINRLRQIERMPRTNAVERQAADEALLEELRIVGRALGGQRFVRELKAVVTNP